MTCIGLNTSHSHEYRRVQSPDCRGQLGTGADPNPVALADWSLEFLWSRNAADVCITRDGRDGKMYTVTLMMGTNDVSRRGIKESHETT